MTRKISEGDLRVAEILSTRSMSLAHIRNPISERDYSVRASCIKTYAMNGWPMESIAEHLGMSTADVQAIVGALDQFHAIGVAGVTLGGILPSTDSRGD